ncbi:6261_t:CDS:2 [Funneliformis geosporum]|uniref:6261_t:CDS:1 n=1 Tax=Funneliformis geosporum TaxID=1117311 RepID=A0A9W4X156_9GLOM|nr:6261_t:CDS:2 [Funneliformis geosporum]
MSKQKQQFKSYYCLGCKQRKPCQILTGERVLADKQKGQENRVKRLKLLRKYASCKKCGSLKTGRATGELTWDTESHWYQKRWGINLKQEAQELQQLFASSLKTKGEKLKNCACKKSEKIRVDSDYYAWCETCGVSIIAASKKRVIKNRNDPRFWGLKVSEKVLCGNCLEERKGSMKPLRRAKFNEYKKLGRV